MFGEDDWPHSLIASIVALHEESSFGRRAPNGVSRTLLTDSGQGFVLRTQDEVNRVLEEPAGGQDSLSAR
jgi:hypothetical protein